MRKIKITALLLAVLMVVTAFAGCASKSTVENLDNKVNDLDAEIKSQSDALKAIQDSLNKLAEGGSSSDSDKELDDIKDAVEKNEKDVASILDAIEKLTEDIKKANEKVDDATGNNDDVKKAISQYGAKIDDLKGKFEDTKSNYAAEDVVAIREIYGDAQASISNCTTADAVKAVYDDMLKKLEAYKGVNTALYEAIVALQGKITDASAEKVIALVEQKDDAVEFYGSATDKALAEYAVSADEKADLVDLVNKLEAQQNTELGQIKDRAAALVKAINAIDATYSYDDVMKVYVDYLVWEDDAEKLSPENVKLVTNYDKLTAAMDSSLGATKALAVIKNSVLTSKLTGAKADIFYDYVTLLAAGEQAIITYQNSTGKILLTSEIYAAIDAAIASWAKEYKLTDAAVEYIIDTVNGKDFYALYTANKALNAAFEAEYKKLTAADGTFTAIKSLNSKLLGADAYDVVTKFEANAKAINNWKKALEEAYAKEVRDNKIPRTVSVAQYPTLLETNFNAMTRLAQLGVFVPATQNTAAYYTLYTYGFNTSSTANYNYFALYDFAKPELAAFVRDEYPIAKAAANLINKKIENYAPTSFTETETQSIAKLVEGIGGYYALNAAQTQLVEVDLTTWNYQANTPVTIAQFEYKYADRVPYDLTGLIDTKTYEEKIDVIEAAVEKARQATLKLEDAYRAIVDGKVTLTMSTYSQYKSLYSLYETWYKTTARIVADGVSNMRMAIPSTVNGVGYDLVDILDGCDYISEYDVLKWSNGTIRTWNNNATKLNNLASAVTTGYGVMDAMNTFKAGAFGINNQRQANTQKAMIVGSNFATSRSHFGSTSVTEVTISSAPMDRDGIDASATPYLKDQYKWSIKYWVFDGTKFVSKSASAYFYGNNAGALGTAYYMKDNNGTPTKTTVRQHWSSLFMSSTLTDWASTNYTSTNLALAYELFTVIPNAVAGVAKGGAKVTAATATAVAYPTDMKNKVLGSTYVANLVMSLNSLFDIMNDGEAYAAIDTAKKAWDPANGGYGLTFLKEVSWLKLIGYGVSDPDMRWTEINSTSNLTALRLAVADIVAEDAAKSKELTVAGTKATKNIGDWMIEADGVKFGALTFGGESANQYVVYQVCNHDALIAGLGCVNMSTNCPDCGEKVYGTAACSSNPAVTCLTATGSEVCQFCGLPLVVTHTYATTATITETSTGIYTIAVNYTCSVCQDSGSASKNNVEFIDANENGTLDDGETITYFFYVGGSNLSVEAKWDAATSKWISLNAVTIQ